MRAKLGLVGKEFGFVEFADEVAQLEHGAHELLVVGAGMEVALRRRMLCERGSAAQVEHEVERFARLACRALKVDRPRGFAHAHALAVVLAPRHVDLVAEVDRAFGTDIDAGVAARAQVEVDRVARRPGGFEGAEPTGEFRQLARMHSPLAALRQRAAAGDEQADLQAAEHRRCAFGGVRITDDETPARALVADGRHRLGLRQLRGSNQRRDLRRGLRRIFRPATRLADVDEADRPLVHALRADGLLVQFEKEPALLRASDEQVVARLGGALELRRLASAQRRVEDGRRRLAQRLRQQGAVQRHRPVAVADQRFHR